MIRCGDPSWSDLNLMFSAKVWWLPRCPPIHTLAFILWRLILATAADLWKGIAQDSTVPNFGLSCAKVYQIRISRLQSEKENSLKTFVSIAAISCSPTGPWLGVVGFGFWLTGKLGRAWYRCMVWCMVGLGVSINDVGVLPGWWRHFWWAAPWNGNTKTQIRPPLTCRHQDYMILLLYF